MLASRLKYRKAKRTGILLTPSEETSSLLQAKTPAASDKADTDVENHIAFDYHPLTTTFRGDICDSDSRCRTGTTGNWGRKERGKKGKTDTKDEAWSEELGYSFLQVVSRGEQTSFLKCKAGLSAQSQFGERPNWIT